MIPVLALGSDQQVALTPADFARKVISGKPDLQLRKSFDDRYLATPFYERLKLVTGWSKNASLGAKSVRGDLARLYADYFRAFYGGTNQGILTLTPTPRLKSEEGSYEVLRSKWLFDRRLNTNTKEMLKMGQRLLEIDSEDPMVRLGMAWIHGRSTENDPIPLAEAHLSVARRILGGNQFDVALVTADVYFNVAVRPPSSKAFAQKALEEFRRVLKIMGPLPKNSPPEFRRVVFSYEVCMKNMQEVLGGKR